MLPAPVANTCTGDRAMLRLDLAQPWSRSRPIILHRHWARSKSALSALRVGPGHEAQWQQNTTEVDVFVTIDDDIRSRDIEFEIYPQRMRLSANGADLLAGTFPERVQINGCFWEIHTNDEDQRMVRVTLEKETMGHESFQNLIEGEATDLAVTDHVYFDIGINGNAAGRLVLALYGDKVPLTVENFKQLCLGNPDPDDESKTLTYANSPFHRIIPGFMIQGGDITAGNGTGGKSIYGRSFPDEDLTIKHDSQWQLSMANAGPNSNGSQFFITMDAAPWLNGKHTVFGRVESGFDLLVKIEDLGSEDGTPKGEVMITGCGVASDV